MSKRTQILMALSPAVAMLTAVTLVAAPPAKPSVEAARLVTYEKADGQTHFALGLAPNVKLAEADAHIMTIAVSPRHRRNGIASRLMLAMIDSALEAGAEHLTLELRVSNAAARGLYERFGFSPVGIRPRYYVDEDALVMWAVNASGVEYSRLLEQIREEVA